MNTSTDTLKLHYFTLNSRGAIPRAILYSNGVNFIDQQYNFEEWGKVKKSGDFEFEQMPMLEAEGMLLTQSIAIDLYLSRKYNLLGTNLIEEYLIISERASYDDFYPKFRPGVFPMTDQERTNQTAKEKEFLEIHAPFYLGIYEQRFNKNGGKFAVGNTFSLADIYLTVHLTQIFKQSGRKDVYEKVLIKHAPNVAAHIEKIAKNELASYYEKGYIAEAVI